MLWQAETELHGSSVEQKRYSRSCKKSGGMVLFQKPLQLKLWARWNNEIKKLVNMDLMSAHVHGVHLTANNALILFLLDHTVSFDIFEKSCATCDRCRYPIAIRHAKSLENRFNISVLINMQASIWAVPVYLDAKEVLQFAKVLHCKFLVECRLDIANSSDICAQNDKIIHPYRDNNARSMVDEYAMVCLALLEADILQFPS